MRRLSHLQERRHGQEVPEKEFLLAAGDAGAQVVNDKDGNYILTFDDKGAADDFLADHDFPVSVKVWRDQREDGDRFMIEVDKQTAREAFTPDADAYATEMSEAMRVKDLGGDFSVTVPAAEVEAFKDRWPGSELPDRAITFTFQKKNGDLVDIYPEGVDGPDAVALSQDAQNFGAKKLGLGATAMRERREPKEEPSECHHFIRHANTAKERDQAKKALDYARSVNDPQGTMLALAQLQGCPKKSGKAMGEGSPDSEQPIGSGKNGYIAFYKNKRYEVYGDTILGAQTALAQALKIPPRKQSDINITLAQKGGVDVVHTPTEGRMVNLRAANESLARLQRQVMERAEAPPKGEPDLRWDDSEVWQARVEELMENPLDNDYFFKNDYQLGNIRDKSKSNEDFLEKVEAAGLTDKLKKMAEKDAAEDSDIYTWAYEHITDAITDWMKEKGTDRWVGGVTGFGWQKREGGKEFRASDGKKLLDQILPRTQNRFEVYLEPDQIRIENWHHDAPTGGEWYTIKPAPAEEE